MILFSFRKNLCSWYFFHRPPDFLYTPGLTISRQRAIKFLGSAEGSASSKLSIVRASTIG